MQLKMFHGRIAIDETLDDWGFDGPTLEGVASFHVTYVATFRVVFTDKASFNQAQQITNWRVWDELSLQMEFVEDLLRITNDGSPKYFGDWSLL